MVFERGFYVPFDQVELAEVGGAAVTLNGNVALSFANSTFAATLNEPTEPDDDPELDEASAQVGLRGAVTLELSLEAGAEITGSLNLAVVPLPAFTVAGEITVSPFVRIRLHLTAAADAAARISLVAPFRFGSGFAFDGVTPRGGMARPPRHAPEVGLPDTAVVLTAKVELEATLVLQLTVSGLPIGGPALGTSVGVLLDLDPVAGIDLDGALEIVGGWVPPAVVGELPDIPEQLPVLYPVTRVDIVAGGPLAPGLAPTRWSRLFDIVNDDNAAALLPAGDGLVVVESNRIAGIPWLAELDAAGVSVWQSTSGPNDSWTPLALAYALDGDILVAGTGGGVRVDRFSPAGEPRWTRR
jgi:hypothetical protein